MQAAVAIPEIGYYSYATPEDFQDALVLARCGLRDYESQCFAYTTLEAAEKDADCLQQIMTAFGYPLDGLKIVELLNPVAGGKWAIKLRSKYVRFSFECKK